MPRLIHERQIKGWTRAKTLALTHGKPALASSNSPPMFRRRQASMILSVPAGLDRAAVRALAERLTPENATATREKLLDLLAPA